MRASPLNTEVSAIKSSSQYRAVDTTSQELVCNQIILVDTTGAKHIYFL